MAREITEEHRRAVEWLNNVSVESVGFFALEVELWSIGGSAPAPKFNLVCQPNEWLKGITEGEASRGPTATKLQQLEFWKGFRDYAEASNTFLSLRKPRPQQWYALAVGRAGFSISLTVHQLHQGAVSLHLRVGDSSRPGGTRQRYAPSLLKPGDLPDGLQVFCGHLKSQVWRHEFHRRKR